MTGTRIATIAAGFLLAVIAATPIQAGSGTARASSPQYDASMLRGQALNVLYGLGKPDGMTQAQYRAELIRSTALNERYGIPTALSSDAVARLFATRSATPVAAPEAPVAAPAGNGFDWTDATIGAGVGIGLLLLGAAGARVVRRHGHTPHLHL